MKTLLATAVALTLITAGSSAAFAQAKAKPKAVAKPAAAVSATTPVEPVLAADKSARVIFLDKQTNRKQVLIMVAGQIETVATLQVSLKKCLPDYGGALGQDVAWLDVNEIAENTSRSGPWFSGWMFNTYPEVSTMDHPRYDIQLQGCGAKPRQIIRATGAVPVIESAPPEDTESAGDNDFVVPGVPDKTTPTEPVPTEAPAEPAVQLEQPTQPAAQPIVENSAPIAQPVESTPAAAHPTEQQDLHQMMDTGTY